MHDTYLENMFVYGSHWRVFPQQTVYLWIRSGTVDDLKEKQTPVCYCRSVEEDPWRYAPGVWGILCLDEKF